MHDVSIECLCVFPISKFREIITRQYGKVLAVNTVQYICLNENRSKRKVSVNDRLQKSLSCYLGSCFLGVGWEEGEEIKEE